MNDHDFLSAVLANPTDLGLRLVYADWLEEQGDPRGEFLRAECQLRELRAEEAEYPTLRARVEALRARCPDNWLAALDGPVWCVAANVVLERKYGPGGQEVRRGTRHFAPGAKVYVFDFYWGMGGENVTVVGRHRKSHRYIALTMRAVHLANWRPEMVYSPAVIRQVLEYGEFARLPRGGDRARKWAEEIVASYNQRGAPTQPFLTRPPGAERRAAEASEEGPSSPAP